KLRAYFNEKWFKFSEAVQRRDGYKCLKCGRKKGEVVLQTHHKQYKRGVEIWEYPLCDCITLCKGCHAEQHGIIEPTNGWTLISIDDLGGLYGTCEKKGCGTDIRYEHLIYHPDFGYKVVGSSCVEFLTREDQYLSQEVLKVFKKISDFIKDSVWEIGYTKNNKMFYFATHSHHQIRIYGKENFYSYQIVIKQKGNKWFDFGNFISANNKTLEQVKELGYIVLKGTITDDKKEKDILRNIYKKIR
ncbi:MAG: hypothetical protein PHE56_02765, partial [Bacteroidales bacterium]|nr:hypothetical protein [Bacteroidales bacterium]